MTQIFVVPMPPNLANARMHWRKKDRERMAYFGTLDLLRAVGRLPTRPVAPHAKARIQAHMFLPAMMDHDNAVARLKWAIDWLVRNGYLAGDNPRQLEWAGFPEQTIKRDKNYRVEFAVTELR